MIVLASLSPQRRKLIRRCIWNATVRKLKTTEKQLPGEDIYSYIIRTTLTKAQPFWGSCVISADTAMLYRNKIIGKPTSKEEAFKILTALQGHTHFCFTSVLIHCNGKTMVGIYRAQINIRKMNTSEITSYLETGEFKNRAGGYAIQGKAKRFTKLVDGDVGTVIGLPVKLLCRMMHGNPKIAMKIGRFKIVGNVDKRYMRHIRKIIAAQKHPSRRFKP